MDDLLSALNEMKAAYNSLKAGDDKALAELGDKLADSLAVALSFQEKLHALEMRFSDFEREKAEFHEHVLDRENYHLRKLPSGSLAYKYEQSAKPLHDPHYLCQPCYDNVRDGTRKVVLKNSPWPGGTPALQCSVCKERY
jgi:hypothetical protein